MTLLNRIADLLEDNSLCVVEQVQSLWSGYGQIVRIASQAKQQQYIVKVIRPQQPVNHPRGWNTPTSHSRKLKSYHVEAQFYQHYSALTDNHCVVPKLHASSNDKNGTLLVMEDLDALGFTQRLEQASWPQLKITIRWLAYFHANFMDLAAPTLWPCGTYWYLDTRQDELAQMPQNGLKYYASELDHALSSARYQTLVHGDAKLANFCYHNHENRVAAVDFQYVGKGPGVKDLAYLAGSALQNDQLVQYGDAIVDEYITHLIVALDYYQKDVDEAQLDAEIRQLYPLAWADFYRFLLGWNPKSWKVCDYMQQLSEQALKQFAKDGG